MSIDRPDDDAAQQPPQPRWPPRPPGEGQPAPPPGHYYPYPYPPPGYLPYPPPTKTNGFAIAALVLGICGFLWLTPILAVVFGHVSLSQIKSSQGRQSGRGQAIAGLVLGWLWIALFATLLTLDAVLGSRFDLAE